MSATRIVVAPDVVPSGGVINIEPTRADLVIAYRAGAPIITDRGSASIVGYGAIAYIGAIADVSAVSHISAIADVSAVSHISAIVLIS